MLFEASARNSFEEAQKTAGIMKAHGWTRV
jgi:hypothetical protein